MSGPTSEPFLQPYVSNNSPTCLFQSVNHFGLLESREAASHNPYKKYSSGVKQRDLGDHVVESAKILFVNKPIQRKLSSIFFFFMGTVYLIIAESIFISSFLYPAPVKPGHSTPVHSNGVEVIIILCFHRWVLHQILLKLKSMHSFERHNLPDVAAELYQYIYIYRSIVCDIRSGKRRNYQKWFVTDSHGRLIDCRHRPYCFTM